MKTKTLFMACFAASSLALSAGFVLGQQAAPLTPAQQAFVNVEKKVLYSKGTESVEEMRTNVDSLVAAFAEAPESGDVVLQIMKSGVTQGEKPQTLARLLTLQVAQNQKLIEQNAQILAALKAGAKTPAK